jgi:cellulose synthase/poly-beta-1,6-N-acetylglucosamine synthase-like glycosyltransferase
VAIVTTVAMWAGYVVLTIISHFVNHGVEGMRFVSEAVSYLVVVTFLSFSALMYLLARQGALYRFRTHVRVPRAEIDRHFAGSMPTLTVLIPSYREDPRVIRSTLLSAALQEYPHMRVVLLLDDPPEPTDPEAAEQLAQARRLTAQLSRLLAEPRARFVEALERFEADSPAAAEPTPDDAAALAGHFAWAVRWLDGLAEAERVTDHVDTFFVEQVIRGLSRDLALVGEALEAAAAEGAVVPRERMVQLYRRLAWTFRADLETFERKRYASLSHEPNKAMNLNSYIGVMGRRFREVATPDGVVLVPSVTDGDVIFPDSDYLLTLDADSVLLREYCLRLVYLLEQPQHARVAVTQTPYSAFPGSGTRLERLAGATTDLQHILHQGMSHYGAAFWVGANAVLRKAALEDIVEVENVGGFEVRRYVQDRTVIEDTESSIDLGVHGWALVNYPERLSYSATPPDFGSLVIQRRRWADGGLLILPKLWRVARERRRRLEHGRLAETLLRVNYMASIAWASFGLVFLLAYPYDSRLLSPLVLCAALPYFLAMASDLKACGYKRTDVLRIYGFNLVLLPVNLAGVLKSLQQALTGRKIAFARTPKVRNRTSAPVPYVVVPYLIVAFSLFTLWRDLQQQNWGNAAFAAFNALLCAYAIVAFVGVRNSVVDLWVNLVKRLYVTGGRRAPRPVPAAAPAGLDWRSVLYHGTTDVPVDASVPLLEVVRPMHDSADVELRLDGDELAVRILRRQG